MINSIESERLENLIRQKIKRYRELKEKVPDNPALLYLNSEITFLRDSILPIVLADTTVDYSEIRDFVTKTVRKLEKNPLSRKATDLVLHIHIKDAEPGQKALAIVSSSQGQPSPRFDIYVDLKQSNQINL